MPSDTRARASSMKNELETMSQEISIMPAALFNPAHFIPSLRNVKDKETEEEEAADAFNLHRGELSIGEKYRYDLSRAQLKATSNTSALLAGFAMVALVELHYDENMPLSLLVVLGIVTTLLVSFHLIALMISTCLLPYIDANGCTKDSPHIRLRFYIELSWLFSTCIGLLLFLLEIGIIFFVKFLAINFILGAYITSAILAPVFVIFIIISYLLHRDRLQHSIDRVDTKMQFLENIIEENALLPKQRQQQQQHASSPTSSSSKVGRIKHV